MGRLLSGFSARDLWISLAEVMAAFFPASLLGRGSFDVSLVPGAGRRSAAGEWPLWFALGGGPAEFWKVRGLPAVIGWACARRGSGSAARHRGCGLSGRLGLFAAVDDDLLYLACRVSPEDQLVQVVPVGLAR